MEWQEIAPLEWLTPDKVSDALDRLGALLFIGLGIGSLYLGITGLYDNVYFGVDTSIWIGIGLLLGGDYWWFFPSFWENVSKKENEE